MIFRHQNCNHLSKNRERTVLARIQPQLLFIPSYSSRTVVWVVQLVVANFNILYSYGYYIELRGVVGVHGLPYGVRSGEAVRALSRLIVATRFHFHIHSHDSCRSHLCSLAKRDLHGQEQARVWRKERGRKMIRSVGLRLTLRPVTG